MRINRDLMQAAKQLYNDLKGPEGTKLIKEGGTPVNESPDLSGMPKETQEGVKLLNSLGIETTPDTVEAINQFMTNSPGTTAEKLMAISIVVEKGMPMSPVLMGDIHTSRTVSLVDFIEPAKDPKTGTEKSDESTEKSSVYKEAVLSSVASLDGLLAELLDALSTDNAQFVDKIVDNFSESDSYKHEETEISLEGKIKSNEPLIFSKNEKLILSEKDDVKEKAEFLDEEAIIEFLEKLTEAIEEMPIEEVEELALSLVETLPQAIRIVLEETITPKLAQVRNDFESFKKEVKNQLGEIIAKDVVMPKEHKVQVLNKLIDKLDHAVMKSEIGLYISLKGERDLLKQSAVLADAKTMLMKGEVTKAEALVKQVVTAIEEMAFKPTLQKAVVVMPLIQSKMQSDFTYEDVKEWSKEMIDDFSKSEKSPAMLTHYLRRMGVNHEAEVFQKVFGTEGKQNVNEASVKSLENLKSMLMTLSKTGTSSAEQETISKTLSHINGQQLNMKVVDKAQPQQLMINIPMSLEGHLTDVKVFIKSKQQDMKVDWQNFNMFFVLDTKSFGDVGIKVAAVDKKVKVEVLNNNANAEASIKPLTEMLKTYVEEVGFSVTGINFNSWGNEHPTKKNSPKEIPRPTPILRDDRGFDFKV